MSQLPDAGADPAQPGSSPRPIRQGSRQNPSFSGAYAAGIVALIDLRQGQVCGDS